MFALIDCNNFYASCERLFNPNLNQKPVVVLSNNDGCIIARSQEAKDLGIKMGTPIFEIKDLIEKSNVRVYSSNYTLYGDISHRVMTLLAGFAPDSEIYSIDECFLCLKGFDNNYDLREYAQKIRKTILKSVGIPVCVGIGQTKTLAKIANRVAKKQKNLNGICVLDDEADIRIALKQTQIEDVWGIGFKYSEMLKKSKIFNALEFCNLKEGWVKQKMTIVGVRTWHELNGKSCINLEKIPPDKKAICSSRSFGKMLSNYQPIEEAVSTFASRCAKKLRRQKSAAGVIIVFLYTNFFNKQLPQYSKQITIKLPTASNSSIVLVDYACKALSKIYKEGYQFKKAGVIVTNIMPQNEIVVDMFDTTNREKHRKVMLAMDRLNNRFGREKIKIGKQGFSKEWHLKCENLSPCYTTQLSDLISIH